jgi:hypothetical protein
MGNSHKKTLAALTMLLLIGVLSIGLIACVGRVDGTPNGEDPNGQEGTPQGVVYEDLEYGFKLSLPEGWTGYSVELDEWKGTIRDGSDEQDPGPSGPIIAIRHPEWKENKPRQDIPIMVFTLAQWAELSEGKFHIGAAPVGPTELGRNDTYVFALPARYNYAFLEGHEEVQSILDGSPLEVWDLHTTR